MNKEFNLLVLSDDANFCSALALECNNYGFELTFFESVDLITVLKDNDKLISVIIVDLNCNKVDERLKIGEQARLKSNFPIFGIVDKVTKEVQRKSKDYGFDLIFSKRMLLKSLKKVVIHILDQ